MADVKDNDFPRTPSRLERFRRVWFGAQGLRSGWAISLYCAIVAALVFALDYAGHRLHHPLHPYHDLTTSGQIPFELALCAAALIATYAMGRVDRQSWLDYGLRAPHRALHFAWGAMCGFAAIAAIMGLLVLTGGATIRYSGVGATAALESGIVWAATFVLVAFTEEVAYRGYPFFKLVRQTHPVVAAMLTSVAFGISHVSNRNENIAGIVPIVIYGLVASVAVWRTGSLWWVIGEHAMWDWSESFLFGATNSGLSSHDTLFTSRAIGPVWLSGGTVGPEASALVFPLLAVLAYAAWRLPMCADPDRASLPHARKRAM
ncbi:MULTISPECIES: CPBP family intramembrane glutamic endopeptidase [Burkholderia]|uniref:CPBP family intramembrane glutamic endopeptidase n=1 Tax=Burkholderia TaxID=32008 RepID=UPI0008417826|nr:MULTISPECIES: CPBP family intramembrane glutamic endopeptidase [unclassified Burkholderia]AOK31359.1 CAAX protease [Burkholderia sp. Bp7605]